LLTKMENIKDDDLRELEMRIVKAQISEKNFKVFLWPDKPKDIPDTTEMKLVIIPQKDEILMKNILESKGDSPRVYMNTIFFLCPSDTERNSFLESIKRTIAYQQIKDDNTINLTEEQKREVSTRIQKENRDLEDKVKGCYRIVYAPAKGGLKDIDLGIPTYGDTRSLDEWVYDGLRSEKEILEKISPLVIQQRYLGDKDAVKVRQIYESMLRTPGESRVISRDLFEKSILQGVKQGSFGLGELEEDGKSVNCKYFKTDANLSFDENEVIIKSAICEAQKEAAQEEAIEGRHSRYRRQASMKAPRAGLSWSRLSRGGITCLSNSMSHLARLAI
jgi:hypothetical protein